MSALIPESHLDLIAGPVFCVMTTLAPDGTPENSVVWCSWDGTAVLVNTTDDRRKTKNVRSNPQVALIAIDPQNPYRWVDVRGVVTAIEPDLDLANINAHARLYMGVDAYYGSVAPAELADVETRVILRITPEKVVTYNENE